jgi:hypothetical protein
LGRYCEQCDGDGVHEKSWCIESQNLMPLATDKYSENLFGFMKSKELMVGENSKPARMCFELAGTNFTIGKMKI